MTDTSTDTDSVEVTVLIPRRLHDQLVELAEHQTQGDVPGLIVWTLRRECMPREDGV